MDESYKGMYLNMFFGKIGIVLVGLGALRYMVISNDSKGYIILFLGFSLVVSYIYYLEKSWDKQKNNVD
ncbi:hypothetical protein [Metabacillus litoralis]|jgi:hypothetical protein|uniref:hypothetical protein n=1 Tax=Metabacillus litoralis TaxID=152268 RepID=UPI00203C3B69|nr:hypothetical protein [Metabacillus litoralis]MCM3651615.1 hypothetical protein [Metabacillus litoralis]